MNPVDQRKHKTAVDRLAIEVNTFTADAEVVIGELARAIDRERKARELMREDLAAVTLELIHQGETDIRALVNRRTEVFYRTFSGRLRWLLTGK